MADNYSRFRKTKTRKARPVMLKRKISRLNELATIRTSSSNKVYDWLIIINRNVSGSGIKKKSKEE